MELDVLRLTDFLSYERSEVCLKDRGLVLIEGENGAGKSNLFDSILWVLFGTTPRGLSADKVIRDGKSSCEVYLRFKTTEYSVEVCRKRGPHAGLRVWINGAQQSKGRDTQAFLEQIIKVDYDTFIQVAMRAQRTAGFASKTDSQQKELLGKILDFSKFSSAEERAKKSRNLFEREVELTNLEIKNIQQRIADCKERITKADTEREVWEIDRNQKLTKAKEDLSLLLPTRDLQKLRLEEELAVERLNQYDLGELRSTLSSARRRSQELREQRAGLGQRIAGLSIKKPFVDIDETLKSETICPACNRPVVSEGDIQLRRAALEQKNRNIEAENTKRDADKAISESDYERIDSRIKSIDAGITECEQAVSAIDAIANALADVRQRIAVCERDEALFGERRRTLINQIKELEVAAWPFQNYVRSETEKAAALEETLLDKKWQVEITEDKLAYAKFWVEGFGRKGIPSLLLDQAIPCLTEQSNIYLQELSDGLGSVKFNTTKDLVSGKQSEVFHAEITYAYGGSSKKSCISGGELVRAEIAIAFALHDLAALRASIPLQYRLLDEPFESLDKIGCEKVISLLYNYILPKTKSIFVMTHNDAMKSLFERRIRIVKEGGISRIIDG